MLKYFLILFGISSLLGCSLEANRQENIQEIDLKCQDIDNWPPDYKELCDCYRANKYLFPAADSKEYILYQNIDQEYGETYQAISSGNKPEVFDGFRTLLSDSSNFRWGETGTPWSTHKIDFINSKNEIIARITIGSGGMIWTNPDYRVAKWGSLTDEGYDEVTRLLEMIMD